MCCISPSLYLVVPQGTSRATKYHVLVDENRFTADAMQGMIYK
jgi:hypothetical protein